MESFISDLDSFISKSCRDFQVCSQFSHNWNESQVKKRINLFIHEESLKSEVTTRFLRGIYLNLDVIFVIFFSLTSCVLNRLDTHLYLESLYWLTNKKNTYKSNGFHEWVWNMMSLCSPKFQAKWKCHK